MSWLDVAAAPSSPSAVLPTAAAAPLPASMILTHCNEPPARGAKREGRAGREGRGRMVGCEGGGRGCEEVAQEGGRRAREKKITCREEKRDGRRGEAVGAMCGWGEGGWKREELEREGEKSLIPCAKTNQSLNRSIAVNT